MSVKTYTDTTHIIKTIEGHVWEIHCDAIGCNASLEFRENQDTGDITADAEINDPRPGASHARRMRSAGRARSERKEGDNQ